MSELRDRMIQDLKLAGLSGGTRREYLRAVRQLAAYYTISPDRLDAYYEAHGDAMFEAPASNGNASDGDDKWELGGVKIPWPAHFSLPPEERSNCLCTIALEHV